MDNFFILNEAPENAMNPYWLKQEGIRLLQEMVGKVWSHYNDVDPGVTLLEHMCWALSEIAYCADFPLEDLLAGVDGSIAIPDQFPKQADILSHQPITEDDFGKLLLDNLTELRAVKLIPEYDINASLPTGRHLCYLAVKAGLDNLQSENIRQSAWKLLRAWRMLGHDFLPPLWLTPRIFTLSARILVAEAHHAPTIAEYCRLKLDDFAAPAIHQDGYRRLRKKGLDGAHIIDGPKLNQGWMPGVLPSPPKRLRLSALASLLADIDGVQVVLQLQLKENNKEIQHVAIQPSEIIKWALDIELWCDDRCCLSLKGSASQPSGVAAMKLEHASTDISAGIDLQTHMPKGRYRQLSEYHLVQTTLPPNWGMSAQEVEQSEQQLAHKRQLQGYLMPFEQLLTNQLAQLAHIGELFSPASPLPTQRSTRPEDVSWCPLARTYFSQPLYQVPGIDMLLSGQQLFDVWLGEPRPHLAWRNTREFSHNVYRHALSTLMESEHEAIQRRLNFLRHLMARHGEESSDYDAMITSCQWYGSRERTLTIVFSLWLQNLVFLSQARCCGARYPALPLLKPGDPRIPETCQALTAHLMPLPGITGNHAEIPWWERLLAWPDHNGQPDLSQIQAIMALDETALIGMSSFELKVGLLLNLSARLWNMAAQLLRVLHATGIREWFRTSCTLNERFMLDHSELYLYVHANGIWLCEGDWQAGKEIEQALLNIAFPLSDIPTNTDAFDHLSPPIDAVNEKIFLYCHAHASQLLWLAMQRKGILLIEAILLNEYDTPPSLDTCFSASLFWPEWVLLLNQRMAGFIETLRLRHWPTHVTLQARGLSFSQMAPLISSFICWHNSYGQNNTTSADAAIQLRTQLSEAMASSVTQGEA